MSNQSGPPSQPGRSGAAPPHFLVIVPGIMGSRLRDTTSGEIAWVDFSSVPFNPLRWNGWIEGMLQRLRYPNVNLEAAGIIDDVLFLPPWAKQEQYSRLVRALEGIGYKADPARHAEEARDVYGFGYDWRQDNRISGRQLGQAITRWQQFHPGAEAWIIAHSMGGMVSRWYIEKEGGKAHVGRLLLMGSPWDGAPMALSMLLNGFNTLFRRRFDLLNISGRTRDVIRTFPATYQLLPAQNPFLRDETNAAVDIFATREWLEDEKQHRLLLDGRAFNQELGTTLSVETLCFFGAKQPTAAGGLLQALTAGRWGNIQWATTQAGDGTVPESSAVHPHAREKLPFAAGHGDIYVNPAVLEKLEWELIRKYQGGVLAEVQTERLTVMFEPSRDVYSPGEPIGVWATVHQRHSAPAPVFGARIRVQIAWAQPLPGERDVIPPADLPTVELPGSADEAGRYEGTLVAPGVEGYYRLKATVEVDGERPLELEELVLVEGVDEPPPAALSNGAEATMRGRATAGGSPDADGERSALDVPSFAIPAGEPDPATDGGVSKAMSASDGISSVVPPGSPAPPTSSSGGSRGGATASIGVPPGSPAQPDSSGGASTGETPVPAAERYVNFQILGHDLAQPLPLGTTSTLAFSVDTRRLEMAVAAPAFDESHVFAPGQAQVILKIYLTSKDFTIHTPEPQSLRVPRSGRSQNTARFDVEPLRAGVGEITAIVYKDNNFVQGMALQLRAGTADGAAFVGAEPLGRAPDSAFAVKPRDVSLFIRSATDGFEATLVTTGAADATLRLTTARLNQLIGEVRDELQQIVYLGTYAGKVLVLPKEATLPRGTERVYQTQIDIPEEVNQQALRRLAKAGYRLYQEIFYAQNDLTASRMGDRLRDLAQKETLKIQIVSQQFLLPWGVLYLAEDFDENNVDPELFLGLRHIVEHIPLQQNMPDVGYTIASQPALSVGVNVDADIDQQFRLTAVDDQIAYWDKVQQGGGAKVAVRRTADDLLTALSDPDTADQILYFYGHAVSRPLDHPEGPDSSYLGLSGGKRVTLDDLKLRAPVRRLLAGAPLVFINACESAELSPLFYGGFMPYFTAKGARGMIGTECETPARFAHEWATRFFDAFLPGNKSLGEVFLQLRREFYYQHHNILGLLYALYCDADTEVVPGLRLT